MTCKLYSFSRDGPMASRRWSVSQSVSYFTVPPRGAHPSTGTGSLNPAPPRSRSNTSTLLPSTRATRSPGAAGAALNCRKSARSQPLPADNDRVFPGRLFREESRVALTPKRRKRQR